MQLAKLNFPSTFDFKITKSDKNEYLIFDEIRKKNFVLTPEEWVRQHFIHYLTGKGISRSQIIVEKQFELFQTLKRIDIMVLKKSKPKILIELKAPEISLSEEHFEQVARYNQNFKAEYLLLSNGLNHIAFKLNDQNEYENFLPWEDLFGRVLHQ